MATDSIGYTYYKNDEPNDRNGRTFPNFGQPHTVDWARNEHHIQSKELSDRRLLWHSGKVGILENAHIVTAQEYWADFWTSLSSDQYRFRAGLVLNCNFAGCHSGMLKLTQGSIFKASHSHKPIFQSASSLQVKSI